MAHAVICSHAHLPCSLPHRVAPQRVFGYADVYDWQREVVEALLAGRDTIVARPTGGGKSLCFQLPALVDSLRPRAGSGGPSSADGAAAAEPYKTVVVVTPNVSLMVDQVSQINTRLRRLIGDDQSALGLAHGREFAALLGSAQADPNVARAAMAGEYRLLYITERLLFSSSGPSSSTASPVLPWVRALQALHRTGRLLLLAIDEAHVVRQEWRSTRHIPHAPNALPPAPPPAALCACDRFVPTPNGVERSSRRAPNRWSNGRRATFAAITRASASFARRSLACPCSH